MMKEDDKLIKNGIKYTDQLFETILQRIQPHVYDSETYMEFLTKTRPFTVENPMVTLGMVDHTVNSVLLSIAGNKYTYEANRRLTEQVITDNTANLVTKVGEDVRQTIREIVLDGFKNNKPRQDTIKELTNKISSINNKRAKTIYRTEIKRAHTISNYISARERGANHFYCNCNNPCLLCEKTYNTGEIYSMENDKDKLPPLHPNCRCSAVFIKKEEG